MNHKLLQIYLRTFPPHSSRNTNQGFVLPMMVGLGLIMTLVGLTMIGRSSNDQNLATSQEQSSQSLLVAEAGTTQLINFLNKVRPLAEENLDNWKSRYNDVEEVARECHEDIDKIDDSLNDYTGKNWIEINNNRDRFRVESYNFDRASGYNSARPNDTDPIGYGELSIVAEANYKQNPSKSAIDVKIPVKPLEDGAPGLYVKKADLSNNEIVGNLLLHDCDLESEDSDIDTGNIDGDAKANPFAEFPDLPERPDNYTTVKPIRKNNLDEDGEKVFPLDKENDAQDEDGRYHYFIEENGGDSISLNGGNYAIRIEPGEKVNFYLEGDVGLKGNSRIVHACKDPLEEEGEDCDIDPSNFQVFGGDGGDKTYEGGTTEYFCLSGTSRVRALIFAPEADVGVGGGGKPNQKEEDETYTTEDNAGITGTVWADSWNDKCGSNSSKTLVTQDIDWKELPIPAPRKLASPSSWERTEAPEE